MSDIEVTNEQITIAERLQLLWLKHMEKMLTDNPPTITSTDMSTLAKVLRDNGWQLDKSKLPEKLRNKLTDLTSPEDLADPRLKIA
jgi:hypothetical protein